VHEYIANNQLINQTIILGLLLKTW